MSIRLKSFKAVLPLLAVGSLFLISLQGCATPTPLATPSGWPERVFEGQSSDTVMAAIANVCLTSGLSVPTQTDTHLVCARTMNNANGMFAQLLLGNAYSTTPVLSARFNAVAVPQGVRVVSNVWMETQMALGQVRSSELKGSKAALEVQQMLDRIEL